MGGFIRSGGGVNTENVTTVAEDVLEDKVFLTQEGLEELGLMPNIGGVQITLTADTPTYTPDKGYHNGEGQIRIITEEKSVSPSGQASVEVTAGTGKVLSKVTVNKVELLGTAETMDVAEGKTFYKDNLELQTGGLADKTSTINHQAATVGVSGGYLRMQVPATGKYGTENYLRAGLSSVASAISLSADKLWPGETACGLTGSGTWNYQEQEADNYATLRLKGMAGKPLVAFFVDDSVRSVEKFDLGWGILGGLVFKHDGAYHIAAMYSDVDWNLRFRENSSIHAEENGLDILLTHEGFTFEADVCYRYWYIE